MTKNILIIRNASRFDFGGGELFPINLALEISQNQCRPIIVSRNPKLLKFSQIDHIKTIRGPWLSSQDFSGKRITLFPLYCIWQLVLFFWYLGIISYYRPVAVHPQSRDDFIGATLAAKLLFKKIIWTDHADLKHIYANHAVWYKNPIGKFVYLVSLLANEVTIESWSEKRLIEQSLSKDVPKNYSVIHIGVVDTYTPVKRKNTPLTIVATSRLVTEKGIGELIEAFKLINSSDIQLKLYGDGPDRKRFESMAKEIPGIFFEGHVKDVTSVLQQADIFVHPTYHEGFGLSLVEAAMCSLPTVASNVGSIPEIVKDQESGILVPVKDVVGLAKAIQTLIDNPKLRIKMGRAGRQIFIENFQFDKIVKDKFIPLYEA